MKRVLILDDDSALLEGLEQLLQQSGYQTVTAENKTSAEWLLQQCAYDVLVIDWNLPDGSGAELISSLRSDNYRGPILMLTSNNTVQDKEEGFDQGADDYLCKPFHPKELLLRLESLLRSSERTSTENVMNVGNIQLDLTRKQVKINDKLIHLQPQEYNVFEFLCRNKGIVFTNEQLLGRVWPVDSKSGVETVRSTVYTLRKKIGASDSTYMIESQYRLGYRLSKVSVADTPGK
jgi:DNA-binding response OmpR family regulator